MRWFGVVLLGMAGAAAAAEVRLRSSAVCTLSVVRLADVAEVNADDAELAAALTQIPLCAAPAIGGERQFTQDDVRQLLVLSGATAADVQVTGSETVTVVSETSPRGAVRQQPRGASTALRQAAFAMETSNRREPKRPRSEQQPAPLPKAATDSQKPPKLVERGALCTVNARTGNIRVTTQGKALQAGTLGESIALEMAETKQRVIGRITGSQIVEVGVGPLVTQPSGEAPAGLLPVPVAAR